MVKVDVGIGIEGTVGFNSFYQYDYGVDGSFMNQDGSVEWTFSLEP